MKKWIWIMGVCLMCCSIACNANVEDSSSEEVTEAIPKETQQEVPVSTKEPRPETLTFVDAHGEWYTTTINPNVARHNYRWDFLVNDEKDISYEDENYTIRRGIDVSYYQGEVDWAKVKSSGYDFVFLRIGFRGYGESGILKEDANFYVNIENAQAVGLDVGVYLIWKNCRNIHFGMRIMKRFHRPLMILKSGNIRKVDMWMELMDMWI